MTGYVFAATAACIAGGVLAINLRRKISKHAELDQDHFDLAAELRPFVEPKGGGFPFTNYGSLWDAIGEKRGLSFIRNASGEIASMAVRMKDVNPEGKALCTHIVIRNWILRSFLAPFAFVEAWICSLAPVWPRILAWSTAKLYCEMIDILQAMHSVVS